MCGIVGAVAQRNVANILLEGLSRLEYRGYDSAGLCTIDNGELNCIKTTGKVVNLKRTHPLGNPRCTIRGKCPPTFM